MQIVVNNRNFFAEVLSEATRDFRQLLIEHAGKKALHMSSRLKRVGLILQIHTWQLKLQNLLSTFICFKR